MAATKLADMAFIPEQFASYVIRRTAELSNLVQSGIISASPILNDLVTGGGRTVTLPVFNDLAGDDEVLGETAATVGGITTSKDIAPVLQRIKAWGATELAGALSGTEPIKAIGDLIANYRVRQEQKTLISVLEGAFGASNMSGLVLDITGNVGASAISANAVLDAKQLKGDAAGDLVALAMHSATYTKLQKDNVIQFIPAAESKVQIPTYLGYRVIIDDGLPYVTPGKAAYTITIGGTYAEDETVTADSVTYTVKATDTTNALIAQGLKAALDADTTFKGKFATTINGNVITVVQKVAGTGAEPSVSKSSTSGTVAAATITDGTGNGLYTTYLFAEGAVARGEGVPAALTPFETDRDSLASTDIIITRRAYVLHPQGMAWQPASALAGATPSNAELATGANWSRVADVKKMGIVKLVHTL